MACIAQEILDFRHKDYSVFQCTVDFVLYMSKGTKHSSKTRKQVFVRNFNYSNCAYPAARVLEQRLIYIELKLFFMFQDLPKMAGSNKVIHDVLDTSFLNAPK